MSRGRARSVRAALAFAALVIAAPASIVASGCGSTYRAAATGDDGSAPDAAPSADAPASDGTGSDAGTCAAVVATDPHNCGRCGHDCLGSTCTGGLCDPIEMASVGSNLRHVVLTGSTLFASSSSAIVASGGGIWRMSTSGGAAETFVTGLDVEGMGVLDGTLYFVVDDMPADGVSTHGGLYACAVTATAPCNPRLVAPSTNAYAVAIDSGHVFYTDSAVGRGLMVYTPPGSPQVYTTTDTVFDNADDIYVDGLLAFAAFNSGSFPFQSATLVAVPPDGGDVLSTYTNPNAITGRLIGSKDALYFTAYDDKRTAGGFVHRILRGSGVGCDFAAGQVVRPYGVHADDAHVFWVNQGAGESMPYVGSSIAVCPVAGCCSTAQILWTGDGQASDLTGDDRALYFVGATNGSIWKLAKP